MASATSATTAVSRSVDVEGEGGRDRDGGIRGGGGGRGGVEIGGGRRGEEGRKVSKWKARQSKALDCIFPRDGGAKRGAGIDEDMGGGGGRGGSRGGVTGTGEAGSGEEDDGETPYFNDRWCRFDFVMMIFIWISILLQICQKERG